MTFPCCNENGGLALGKLLHDCPDLVAKNQELTRLVRDSGVGPNGDAGRDFLGVVFVWCFFYRLYYGKSPCFTSIWETCSICFSLFQASIMQIQVEGIYTPTPKHFFYGPWISALHLVGKYFITWNMMVIY